MKLFTTVSLALLGTLLIACSPASTKNTSQTPATATTENIVLRFAVLAFRPVPEMRERWEPVARYLGLH